MITKSNDEVVECASPPCYAHEINPEYNGMANQQSVIETLQALLEAERAGARIAKETVEQISDEKELSDLVSHIGKDEVRYCSMLMTQIKRLGAEPSKNIGDFYEKCMAIEAVPERLAFLNRGQGWVVKRINELLPALNDAELTTELTEMRETHKTNISLTDEGLEA